MKEGGIDRRMCTLPCTHYLFCLGFTSLTYLTLAYSTYLALTCLTCRLIYLLGIIQPSLTLTRAQLLCLALTLHSWCSYILLTSAHLTGSLLSDLPYLLGSYLTSPCISEYFETVTAEFVSFSLSNNFACQRMFVDTTSGAHLIFLPAAY